MNYTYWLPLLATPTTGCTCYQQRNEMRVYGWQGRAGSCEPVTHALLYAHVQVEVAISQEVNVRSNDLVEAAGDLGDLKRVVRQLHFKTQMLSRRWSSLNEPSAPTCRRMQHKRRKNLSSLLHVRFSKGLENFLYCLTHYESR
jgi:hypothetical protein